MDDITNVEEQFFVGIYTPDFLPKNFFDEDSSATLKEDTSTPKKNSKSLKKRGASEMFKEAKENGTCKIKRGKTMKPVKKLKKEPQSNIKVLSVSDTTDLIKPGDAANSAAVTAETAVKKGMQDLTESLQDVPQQVPVVLNSVSEYLEETPVKYSLLTEVSLSLSPAIQSEVEKLLKPDEVIKKYPKKRVRQCEQSGILKFFKAVDYRVRTEEEIHVADRPTSVLDSDTDSTIAVQTTVLAESAGEEEVQVADLLPANFPKQELDIVGSHASNVFQREAVADAQAFVHSVEKPQKNIDARLNSRNIEENCYIVKCCAESILFCGQQYFALRGDKELLHQSMNPAELGLDVKNERPRVRWRFQYVN
uniref:Uncharacterized protein n=1 Tax=Amphimedon queenslandica TaxID=400682 RepID=A0A1X7U6B2_AMPQE